jgi:hypothetical protein
MKPESGKVIQEARLAIGSSIRAPDYWHINLAEEWEVRFWSREFAVSEARLRDAIAKVGTIAGSVRQFLADRP